MKWPKEVSESDERSWQSPSRCTDHHLRSWNLRGRGRRRGRWGGRGRRKRKKRGREKKRKIRIERFKEPSIGKVKKQTRNKHVLNGIWSLTRDQQMFTCKLYL